MTPLLVVYWWPMSKTPELNIYKRPEKPKPYYLAHAAYYYATFLINH